MSDQTQDLKRLYDLKKKQDRMCRNQDKIEYYNEQKEQIRTQAADTTLMPLKSTNNAATLRARLEKNNRRAREIKHVALIIITILAVAAICALCFLIFINNDMRILEKGGWFNTYDPEKPMDSNNSPKTDLIYSCIVMVCAIIAFYFVPPTMLIPHSFYGAIFRWGAALAMVAFPIMSAYNLFLVFPLYGALPILAIGLAIALRIHNAVHENRDNGALTYPQEIQLKEAQQLDNQNKQENIRIKQQAKANSLAERQRELDRLDQQIRDVEDELYQLDQQMRSMNVLPASEFISLPRLLEFLESNQAQTLEQARRLYAKEQAELQKKADADRRRSNERMALYRLYDNLMRIERDNATRAQQRQADNDFYETQAEKDYLKKLENIRDEELRR